jgi:uncharacterized protein involved in exopolysaccharide biosynthesis
MEMIEANPLKSEESLLRLARRHWALVCAVTFGFVLVALIAALVLPREYRAKVVVIPAQADELGLEQGSLLGNLGGLAALAGVSIGGKEQTVEAIAVLKSRQFSEAFIRDNDLMKRFFASKWDESANDWRPQSRRVPTLRDGFDFFDRKVRRITEDKRTGIVTLEITWRDRTEAARWANELIVRINEVMRARAISESTSTVREVSKELALTDSVAVRDSLSKLLETHVKRKTLAVVRREFVFRVLDPAVEPDDRDYVSPRLAFYLPAGFAFGLLVAIAALLLLDRRKHLSEPYT